MCRSTHKLFYSYCLGGVTICIDRTGEMMQNLVFHPFMQELGQPDITVALDERQDLVWPTGEPLFSNFAFSIYPDGEGGYLRLYHDHKEGDRPYAIGRIAPDGRSETVDYLADSAEFFSETQNTFSHIALEELLLHRDRIILHASFIASELGGILFSGPSGVGKSTQAALWERFEGARQINGDRPILGREDDRWIAYGSPYAGSSRCHVNESCPVRAIVLLEQGAENRLTRLTVGQAFHRLFAQTTVNSWNPWFVERVCDLVSHLAASVPVYCLSCTPDRRAVETLKTALKGEK